MLVNSMIKSIASLTRRDLYIQAMPFACGSSFGDLGQLFKAYNSSSQVISREFVTFGSPYLPDFLICRDLM
jgi:hypothetical protein